MTHKDINISQLTFLKSFLESDIRFIDTSDVDYCNDSLHYTMLIVDKLGNKDVIDNINDILNSNEYTSQGNRYKAILEYVNKVIDLIEED